MRIVFCSSVPGGLYNLGGVSLYVLLGFVAAASSVVLTKLAGADVALQAL